jgi:hypothetical protein
LAQIGGCVLGSVPLKAEGPQVRTVASQFHTTLTRNGVTNSFECIKWNKNIFKIECSYKKIQCFFQNFLKFDIVERKSDQIIKNLRNSKKRNTLPASGAAIASLRTRWQFVEFENELMNLILEMAYGAERSYFKMNIEILATSADLFMI